MDNQEIEYIIVRNSVNTLAALCAGSEIKIIDILTGYLWDEEEAGVLKQPPDKIINGDQIKRPGVCKICGKSMSNYPCPGCYKKTPATLNTNN